MVVTIPPEGFEEPSLTFHLIYVALSPETWILAIGAALISFLSVVALVRFLPMLGHKIVLAVGSIAPILCLLVSLVLFAQTNPVLALSEVQVRIELAICFIVGLVAATTASAFLRPRKFQRPIEDFE